MPITQEPLFRRRPIQEVLQAQEEAATREVESVPPNTLLNAIEHDLVEALVESFRLDVPVIRDTDVYIADSAERKVEMTGDAARLLGNYANAFYVDGTEVVIAAPFEGDAAFFHVQPLRYSLNPPRAEIGKSELLLRYVRTDQDGEAVKSEYRRTLASIQEHLQSLAEAAGQFNGQLEALVSGLVASRKQRILKQEGMTAAIGLPLKKREGVPATYSVPVTRRAPRLDHLQSSEPFQPEPALSNEDYEEVLRIMSNMVRVMELSPHAFFEMGEDGLRSHFLVQLNGAFLGQATSETFNFQGKTDILIKVSGKNVFVAECKFWAGKTAFLRTIDQLLSYLSWRDTKTAVLVFNRKSQFSTVLAGIAESAPKHANFKRDLGKTGESTFRYVFAQQGDKKREVMLTVMAFDVPSSQPDPVPGVIDLDAIAAAKRRRRTRQVR
jgi:hypothetical protein